MSMAPDDPLPPVPTPEQPREPRSKELLERELGATRSIVYMLELIHPDRRGLCLEYAAAVAGVKNGKGATP